MVRVRSQSFHPQDASLIGELVNGGACRPATFVVSLTSLFGAFAARSGVVLLVRPLALERLAAVGVLTFNCSGEGQLRESFRWFSDFLEGVSGSVPAIFLAGGYPPTLGTNAAIFVPVSSPF
jgi:hypothetical protein